MRLSIVNGAIEIDGEGGGVPVAEIQRVAALFEQIFGVPPRLKITGRFELGAISDVPGGDPNAQGWDLKQVSGHRYCPVLSLGPEYAYVQLWAGLNNGRSVALAPGRGAGVRIRLVLPTG